MTEVMMTKPFAADRRWAVFNSDHSQVRTFDVVGVPNIQSYLDEMHEALADASYVMTPFDNDTGRVRTVLISTGWRSIT